jgi:hypothetical protein
VSDEIYEQTVQFVEGMLGWLRAVYPANQHQWTNTKVVPGSGGGTQITGSTSTRPDFGLVLDRNRMSCPAYSAFTAFLAANEVFKSLLPLTEAYGAPFGAAFMEPDHAAQGPILDYLMAVTSLEPDAATIREIARNFSGSIADRCTRTKEFAPLYGFTSTLEEIDCGLGYRIRRLSADEYARYIDRHPFLDWRALFLHVGEFAIEKVTDLDLTKPVYRPWRSCRPMLDHIVSSLRILGPGRVAAPTMDVGPADPGAIVIFPCVGHTSGAPLAFAKEYTFTEDKVRDLQCVFKYLANTALPKELGMAVSRLNSANERQSIEDSFIDHIVALEAVYGDSNTNDQFPGSLTFKVAMRAAVFLESNLQDRKAIMKALKDALSLRGKVVHGAGRLTTADNELISAIADLARKTVRSAMLDICAKGNRISSAYFDDLLLEERACGAGDPEGNGRRVDPIL